MAGRTFDRRRPKAQTFEQSGIVEDRHDTPVAMRGYWLSDSVAADDTSAIKLTRRRWRKERPLAIMRNAVTPSSPAG